MGTGFDMTMLAEELGVVPQAVQEIFSGIDERRTAATERNEPLPQFEVNAQFLEVSTCLCVHMLLHTYVFPAVI